MRKYIMLVVSAVLFAFTSCTDSEDIDIKYQVGITIEADQLMSSFREYETGDFDLGNDYSIRIRSYVYDELGNNVGQFKDYLLDYTTSVTFNDKFENGKYTIITVADFVMGNSQPKYDSDIIFEHWILSDIQSLSKLKIAHSGKIFAWFTETLGIEKTEIEIVDGSVNKNISVKPVTSLVYFKVDYLSKNKKYIMNCEKYSIWGKPVNDFVTIVDNDLIYESSFNINSYTRFKEISPVEDINNGYVAYYGYRAFLPTNDMKFWISYEGINNDGSKYSANSSDYGIYTDSYNLESGKQYLFNAGLTDEGKFYFSLAPFSSTEGKGINSAYNKNNSGAEKKNSSGSFNVIELLK